MNGCSRISASIRTAIRAAEGVAGTYNSANFATKAAEVIAHTEVDLDLLVAGISLPVLMPAVVRGGTALHRRGLDPRLQRARGCSPGKRRGLAGVVHRQHASLSRRVCFTSTST